MFGLIFRLAKNQEWSALADDFRTFALAQNLPDTPVIQIAACLESVQHGVLARLKYGAINSLASKTNS